jgi:hypothetical protein
MSSRECLLAQIVDTMGLLPFVRPSKTKLAFLSIEGPICYSVNINLQWYVPQNYLIHIGYSDVKILYFTFKIDTHVVIVVLHFGTFLGCFGKHGQSRFMTSDQI